MLIVLRHAERPDASGDRDLQPRQFSDQDGRWMGWAARIESEAGEVNDWHHHADNETYVYVIRGSIRFDFGPGATDSVEATAGDFVVVPPHTIHRESTSPEGDLEAFVIRVGGEPERVDADGPASTSA